MDPEIVNMDQKVSGSRNCRNGEVSGSRSRKNTAVSGSKNCKNGQKNSGSKNGRNGAISGSQNCRKGDKSFMSFRKAILSERPCKLINDSRVLAAKADQEIMTSLCTFPCILASLVVIFSLSHSVTHVFILWLYSMLDSE